MLYKPESAGAQSVHPQAVLPNRESSHGDAASEQWMAMESSYGDIASKQQMARESSEGDTVSVQ
jgi:hypothetical protein